MDPKGSHKSCAIAIVLCKRLGLLYLTPAESILPYLAEGAEATDGGR